ncbi:hypothetical protein [Pseudomonas sp.]|uniref:hypothetical protein n=1 Tax=Pseudomonas sp. TaxID=306 RepID=UPI00286CA725|nr:hypothetical protein [Pseudomonas sp.]
MASTTSAGIGLFAQPFTVEGVDPNDPTAQLPPDASTNGVYLNIPLWESPSQEVGKSDLLEIWVLEPGVTVERLFYRNAFPVPISIPAQFHLPPQYLQREGEISLWYRVTLGDNGNEDSASPQRFTLRLQVPTNLAEPVFPNATLWGYLNCRSVPSMWEEIRVRIPPQAGKFEGDDECFLDWESFRSLNGVGAIPNTSTRFSKRLSEQEADNGFTFVLMQYDRLIRPIQGLGSALVSYSLYRNNVPVGKSAVGLVKIDRVIPGNKEFCGP